MGQGVHCQIVKLGFGKETLVGNIVVDMYAKSWFECRRWVLWCTRKKKYFSKSRCMISEYVEYGYVEEVQYMVNQESSKLFWKYAELWGSPNANTFSCMRTVYSKIGSINKGRDNSWQCVNSYIFWMWFIYEGKEAKLELMIISCRIQSPSFAYWKLVQEHGLHIEEKYRKCSRGFRFGLWLLRMH